VSAVLSRCYDVIINPPVRWILAIAIGFLVYLLIPREMKFEIRLLLAWDGAVLLLLLLILMMMKRTDAEQTWNRAQREEPNNITALLFTGLTSGASMVVIAFMLNNGAKWKAVAANVHLGLCTLAIFLAWSLLHTFFAIHYARMYYDEIDGESGEGFKKGLEFPGNELVDYWDFMYYSFTIAMCYQTSDISVSSAPMRRFTLIHSILSFIFVAAIIGLLVNVVSNLI